MGFGAYEIDRYFLRQGAFAGEVAGVGAVDDCAEAGFAKNCGSAGGDSTGFG